MGVFNKIKKYFFYRRNLNIGSNTRILTKLSNFGSEPYLIIIGDNCTITPGVSFITHDGAIDVALRYKKKSRIIDKSKFELMNTIIVKDNSFIGSNSMIMPGVQIGPNSIVGAGSVVTKDVPEGVVVAGNPATTICTINEYYKKNENKLKLIPYSKDLVERKNNILKELNK